MPARSKKPQRVAFKLELEWPYKRHVKVFAGAQRYAEEQGWESTIDEFVEERLPTNPNSVPYDGVIGRVTQKLADWAGQLCIPIVNVWMASPAWHQLPGVYPDFEAVACIRAEHMLARGLRRFVVLGHKGRGSKIHSTAIQSIIRNRGFPCNVINLSLHPDKNFVSWQKFETAIEQSMRDWRLPIGVFTHLDGVGRLVAQMSRQKGWRVPHDVAIIAGMNEEVICELPKPSLTSVELGYEHIGYQAARLLDQLMSGQAPPDEPIFVPPQSLVVRESTDFHAVDEPLVAKALAFIANNSDQTIDAQAVANAVDTGLRTLQRYFQEHLGRAIGAEIQYVRLERAKRELIQSSRPIKEIARDVGFGRAMRMYEVFRRELGLTPREYRKQRQLEDRT